MLFELLKETQKTNLLKSDREQELLNKVAKLQEEVTNTMGQNLVLKNNQVKDFVLQIILKNQRKKYIFVGCILQGKCIA